MSNTLRGTRRVAMTAGAMALAAATLFGSAGGALASTAGHRGILVPGNPARSMKPGTSLLSSCGAGDNSSTCNQLAVTAIGQARRALERMGGMSFSLPAYQRLTPAQQLFVVVNHGPGELAIGTGHAGRAAGYGESDTVLMTGVCGPAPSDAAFTWAKAKKLLGIR